MKKVMLVGVGGYIGGKFTEYINKYYPDWQIEAVDSMNGIWKGADFHGYDAVYNVSGLAHANARQGSEELYYAIQSGDAKSIAKAQNVGPKTAQRVVVDLKGSFEITGAGLEIGSETYGTGENADRNVISETAEALTALGYSNMDALRAIRKVEGAESMTVEQLLSAALRHL